MESEACVDFVVFLDVCLAIKAKNISKTNAENTHAKCKAEQLI